MHPVARVSPILRLKTTVRTSPIQTDVQLYELGHHDSQTRCSIKHLPRSLQITHTV
jgi:hypothetical protein